jgi:DNA-binding Lrp family transcriptional regulator
MTAGAQQLLDRMTLDLDDPAEVLELVHAAAGRLRELVGDALVVDLRPPGQNGAAVQTSNGLRAWSTIEDDVAAAQREDLLRIFQTDPESWLSPREVAQRIGTDKHRVGLRLRELLEAGDLEHNGRMRTAAAYRFKPPRDVVDPAEREKARAAARVQKTLERRKREEEARADRTPDKDGTPIGKALAALTLTPSTIPELAERLGIEKAHAARLIRALEDDGDLDRGGRRNGEIVYRGKP